MFIGRECFRSHRIKSKSSGEWRCMNEKEFAEGGYTKLPDGEYVGGMWPGWGASNDYQRR
jgi:hypothetical protein